MHLIPQTWSHWHILISVFPPIGLLFVLGFYLVGLRSGSDQIRRTSVLLIALLGLLSVPIYFSGAGSMAALAGDPRIAASTMNTHYIWGIVALVVLAAAGIAAGTELSRARRTRTAIGDPFFLILGLSALALAIAAIAGELGLNINHRELKLLITIPDISTSQAWSHAHIILNHIPTAGFVFALAFFAAAFLAKDDGMKRGSLVLFVICAIFGVPTYVAGTAAMWALTQPPIPDIEVSLAVINSHRDMALWTLIGLALTGGAAWIELWRSRYRGSLSAQALNVVLLLALVTLGIMTETGHRGGLINHAEIRLPADVLPTDPAAGISPALEAMMSGMAWFVPWQIVHFFGYCLIFGSAFAVAARVLGFWKSVPFAAMHQVLALGFLGVLLNVVSGMFMMLADSYRYVVSDVAFAPKIIFIAIGATAVLYFLMSNSLWNVRAGENAPAAAKWVAAVVLVAWAGVIVFGRMLPYL